jgi:poly(A) polymerase
LHELQATLYRLFPQCYEQSTKTSAGFNPHLSVGQFANHSEAIAKLPQWHPLKFTVDSVIIMSRRRDEPCVVRHVIGVGKLLPKVVDRGELVELILKLEPELTDSERSQRETVLAVVKQACTECLGFEASLHLFGSARLGVENSGSDIDVVCLIPDFVSGKRFLAQVEDSLTGLCQRSQVILDAKFPVLRLQIEGVSIDLLYTQVEIFDGWENVEIRDLSSRIKNTKFIIGCWDADLTIDLVKQYIPLDRFRLLLKAVRAWANSRKIHGNSWGFLGGFSWSLLCAYTCINYRNRDKSVEALIAHFFQVLSSHDWHQVISLTDAGKQYLPKLPQDLLPIVSLIEPCKNTARNVTRSTAKILQSEFVRGAEIVNRILAGKDEWISLYEPIDVSVRSNTLLTIFITDLDNDELQKSSSLLEACIIGLIIQLEQIDIFVRPNPTVERNEDTNGFILFLKLSAGCENTTIDRLTQDFISQLNGIDSSTQITLSLSSTT